MAAKTGFNARLIEKDYFCSIILRELQPLFGQGLVFKGGTSLSKVYAGFHRLSEDLDFAISIDSTATQSVRRHAINDAKAFLRELMARLSWITEVQPLTGANRSMQYNGTYAYTSHITGQQDTINIEIALRELVIEPVETGRLQPSSSILSARSVPSPRFRWPRCHSARRMQRKSCGCIVVERIQSELVEPVGVSRSLRVTLCQPAERALDVSGADDGFEPSSSTA